MSDNTMSKMIKLKSSDGKEIEVPEIVLVKQSQTICRLIETTCTENSIPLVNVNVTLPILEKVFEYCRKHVEATDTSKTEMTGEGCIKDDDLAADEEECASIVSGRKLSTEEKDITTGKMIKLKSNDGEEFNVSETVVKDSTTGKTIKLTSNDGKELEVSETVAKDSTMSKTIKPMSNNGKESETVAKDSKTTKLTSNDGKESETVAKDSTMSKTTKLTSNNGKESQTVAKGSTTSKTIKLTSNDGKELEVSETVARDSTASKTTKLTNNDGKESETVAKDSITSKTTKLAKNNGKESKTVAKGSTTSKTIKPTSNDGKESETVVAKDSMTSKMTKLTSNNGKESETVAKDSTMSKMIELTSNDGKESETVAKDSTMNKTIELTSNDGKESKTVAKDSMTSKMIKLKSSDGKEFEVPETVLVKQSQTICHLIETACTENSIPLVNVNVTLTILEKVFEYCRKHVEATDTSKAEMTTGKGCIKHDDFAVEEEECASILSGLMLSTEEKDSTTSKTTKLTSNDGKESETVAKDSTTSKTIKLMSNDGKELEVSETVAKQSTTISHFIENASTENSIPVMSVNFTSPILEKVFEYCMKHVEAADASKTETTGEGCINSNEELKNWDKQFVDDIDKAAMLFNLIMAANYLNIEGLLDVTCRKMADNVMGKSLEEIRQAFNIKDDEYTAKDEECASTIPH